MWICDHFPSSICALLPPAPPALALTSLPHAMAATLLPRKRGAPSEPVILRGPQQSDLPDGAAACTGIAVIVGHLWARNPVRISGSSTSGEGDLANSIFLSLLAFFQYLHAVQY